MARLFFPIDARSVQPWIIVKSSVGFSKPKKRATSSLWQTGKLTNRTGENWKCSGCIEQKQNHVMLVLTVFVLHFRNRGQNLFEEEPSPENLVGVWICPHVQTLELELFYTILPLTFHIFFTACFDVVENITWALHLEDTLGLVRVGKLETKTPGLTRTSAFSCEHFLKQDMGRINSYTSCKLRCTFPRCLETMLFPIDFLSISQGEGIYIYICSLQCTLCNHLTCLRAYSSTRSLQVSLMKLGSLL